MKNQYFGDIRDLFKYDIILEILLKSSLNNFTFIPMLTPNEQCNDGKRINHENARAWVKRQELRKFLDECIKQNKRNILQLEKFFNDFRLVHKHSLKIYKKRTYFSSKNREEYFRKIPQDLLTNSIILVDPDNGLEVKSSKNKGERYIKYEEVKYLFDRMDRTSILIIFQFIPRVKRDKYFSMILEKIKKFIPYSFIYYVSDNQVVFFILIKDSYLKNHIKNVLYNYANLYSLIVGGEKFS